MLLNLNPLHAFARLLKDQKTVELNVPWPLPWAIEPLRAVIALEAVGACEQWEQRNPRETKQFVTSLLQSESNTLSAGWLDGAFSRNARRIVDLAHEDLSRVYPQPVLRIRSPLIRLDDQVALSDLGNQLGISIVHDGKQADRHSSEETLALQLLGTAGLVSDEFIHFLSTAAQKAGDEKLATALLSFVMRSPSARTVAEVLDGPIDSERLASLFAILRKESWPVNLPDWGSLGLPSLMKALWNNPSNELDRIRRDGPAQLRSARNSFAVRINIARHFLRCFSEEGLTERLDLAEASFELRNQHPLRAWNLLSPHVDSSALQRSPILAAHIYGQAGHAAAKLGQAKDALALFERNLSILPQAFGMETFSYKKAVAGVEHKLGQLIREHPDLPGGMERARQHIERSLKLHQQLSLDRGVSMCLSEMGELCWLEGSFEKAKEWFDKTLQADRATRNVEGQSRILHQLARLHEHIGDLEEALHYIEECDRLQLSTGIRGVLRKQVQNTQRRIRHLLGLENYEDEDDFISTPDETLVDSPRTFVTDVEQRVGGMRARGHYWAAQQLLDRALKYRLPVGSSQFLILKQVGLLLDLRRHEEARAILSALSPVDSATDVEHRLLMARLELQTNHIEQADLIIAALSNEAEPELLGRLYQLRGRIRLERNQVAEAASDFRKAFEFTPVGHHGTGISLELEARAKLKGGDYEAAARLARELMDLNVTNRSKPLQISASIIIGDALLRQGKPGEAAQEYERAIEVAKAVGDRALISTVALERRAVRAWADAGKSDFALLRLGTLIELLDDEDVAVEQRGWVYHLAARVHRANGNLAEYEKAIAIAERCASLSDDDTLRQAVAILKCGDFRQDNWSMEDFDWEETDPARAAIGRARRLRHRTKLDEAIATLAAVEKAVTNQQVLRELLELQLGITLDLKEAGRPVDVAPLLDRLTAGQPDSALSTKLLLLKARAALLDRKYETAKEMAWFAYSEATKYAEYFSIARAGSVLSKAFSELGQREKAVDFLTEIGTYMARNGRLQASFDARYSVCQHLIDMRQLDEALQQLQAVEETASQLNLRAWASIQAAYVKIENIRGQSDAALARIESALQRLDAEGRQELGVELVRLRDAILVDRGELRTATRTRSPQQGKQNAAKSAASQINLLLQSGRHLEAITVAEQALKSEGGSDSASRAIALHNAARAYFQSRKHSEAESLCRESLEVHIRLGMTSGIPGARVTLARICAATQRMDEATAQLRLALAENKEAQDSRGVGICQRLLSEFSGKTSESGRPANARDLIVYSRTLRRSGKAAEAAQALDEALQRARNERDQLAEALVLGAIGIGKFYEREYLEASRDLQNSISLHASLGSAHIGECSSYLARAYVELGKRKDAVAVLERALAVPLPPNSKERLEQQLQRLSRWRSN